MTFSCVLQLICLLTGFSEIHSGIITVSKVSVQAGHSISIPCLYEPRYTEHVKYLCKGTSWPFCKYAARTDKPDNSGKFSISDDTNQRIFTVTINDIQHYNDMHYWCAVEIKGNLDVKTYFQLSVTTGIPSLSVDQQEIVAFEGGSVTVICRHKNSITAWCRLDNTCVTVTAQTGIIDGTTVTISQSTPNAINVTMSELRANNMSWYLCKSPDFQIPVRVTVHELTSTTTTTTTTTTRVSSSTAEALPTTPQHSSLLTSAETRTVQPTHPTINGSGGDNLHDEHKISTRAMILITTLIAFFLFLLVPAAFFGRRMIIRCQAKPEGTQIPEGSETGSDPNVLYATILHNQHATVQNKIEPAEGSVIYSTLHIKMQ